MKFGVEYTMEAKNRSLPESTMPLYRINDVGPSHLSDIELLSVIIGTGVQEEKAMYMGEQILTEFDLSKIGSASIEQLSQIKSISNRRAATITAVLELYRRIPTTKKHGVQLNTPQKAFELVYPFLKDEKVEHFIVLLLDTKTQLIKKVTTSKGSLNANIVHPREVFAEAIVNRADTIIVIHNHPSGDPHPSGSDVDITKKLSETGRIVGIEVLDHLIIGDNRFFSLKEEGFM